MKKLISQVSRWGLVILTALAVPASVLAQALPTVRNFVTFLDERCYQIPNQAPINVPLQLDHLNPVLQGFPTQSVLLQEPQQLCVPVQKNNLVPPPDTLPFIQFVDWKCYGIKGAPLNLPLRIDHLNPVISQLLGPTDQVVVQEPQQLCVPVAKNGATLPADVLRLVQYLDVECFRVTGGRPVGGQTITLTHLNPLFTFLPPELATFRGPAATQLCVPVAKNQQIPPPDILPWVQYSDVLCYTVSAPALNTNLRLDHLNPVLIGMGLPPEFVPVTVTQKLCVPVAKNQMFPPGSSTGTP
ncbi:MAG TPA: hypothetical protein VGR07_04620 [Thermoanaerobaculia bacterium]|jgi:hypothetical protein|nr:hypothetical protein [Thermoanaerobaculia bacterium]